MKIPASKKRRFYTKNSKMSIIQAKLIQRAEADQLRFALPRQIIEYELKARKVVPQTDIWIYPDYPNGFTAVVGAHDRFVYIFKVVKATIVSVDQRLCIGVRPNGSLIYESLERIG